MVTAESITRTRSLGVGTSLRVRGWFWNLLTMASRALAEYHSASGTCRGYTTLRVQELSPFVLYSILVAPSSLHLHQLDWLAQPYGDRRFDPVVATHPLTRSVPPSSLVP